MRRRHHHHTSRTSSMNFHLYPVPPSILTFRVHPIDTPPQASMRASPTRTRPSTAGRTTSTTTSASSPRVRTSSLAVRYNCLPIHRQPSSNTCLMHTQFFLAYRSLCPSSWATRWDDQRGESPIAPQHAYLQEYVAHYPLQRMAPSPPDWTSKCSLMRDESIQLWHFGQQNVSSTVDSIHY